MNITGALVVGVLQQPVDNIHHVAIVGIQVFLFADFEQLFQVGRAAALPGAGAAHRARQAVELHGIAVDGIGVGDHPANRAIQYLLQITHPAINEGFGAGDHHLGRRGRHRQNAMALSKGKGHNLSDRGHINF